MISIQHLTKHYRDVLALDDISLSINRGEFFGLLGPNGSGKTTLVSIMCGLLKASSGKVILNDQTINLVPQELALYPTLTLRENLRFFARLYCASDADIARVIEAVALSEFTDKRLQYYSGGMLRRANIAISLLANPDVLILDEPTVNIDPQSRHLIFRLLQNINKTGTTIIYTTHYLEEAEQLCSRVAIMEQGKLLVEGSPAEILQQAQAANLETVFLQLTGTAMRDTIC